MFWTDLSNIPMRMAVVGGGRAVGCPASVGDTSVGVKDLLLVDIASADQVLQLVDLADLFEGMDLLFLVAIDGQTSGIISTILKPRETLEE